VKRAIFGSNGKLFFPVKCSGLTVPPVAVAEVDDVVDGAVDDLQEVVDADQNGEPLKRLTRKLVYAHMHACMHACGGKQRHHNRGCHVLLSPSKLTMSTSTL
jgi:hypothetical protein